MGITAGSPQPPSNPHRQPCPPVLQLGEGAGAAQGRGLAGAASLPELPPRQQQQQQVQAKPPGLFGAAEGAGRGEEQEKQEEERWDGRVPTEEEWRAQHIRSEEDARVWDSLPEAAKRLSMEGIMSFEAHRVRRLPQWAEIVGVLVSVLCGLPVGIERRPGPRQARGWLGHTLMVLLHACWEVLGFVAARGSGGLAVIYSCE
jgi:hypothetical protein